MASSPPSNDGSPVAGTWRSCEYASVPNRQGSLEKFSTWLRRTPTTVGHPVSRAAPAVLVGKRVTLRSMTEADYDAWIAVREGSRDWLVRWEPRPAGARALAEDRASYLSRCAGRERERQLGYGFGFGIFVGTRFCGEITLSSIQRGPFQSAVIGYWINQEVAGQGLMPESVVAVLDFAFGSLGLHRVEINIVPSNRPSRRVVEKLGLREEGIAVKMLEIDGTWEDHMRFAIVAEEWMDRRDALRSAWLTPD